MDKRYLNPDGIWKPAIYTQVITTRGGTTVHIAGQTAYDENGQVVAPGDLAAQIDKALSNVQVALRAAGADWTDVVKMVSYVVDYEPSHRALLAEVRNRYFTSPPPATTLIGVQALAMPGLMYEVDVTAVIE
ncbi:MAG TPA: Rid family hydrolase [Candidatus Nitrosotalea sp.]|nr:Rid family hydrolase [Candidatus Nitrosotalea sp.]